tara:strand:+ start:22592 stop:22792 length:201 start_codon:yes stop_codon:yes gene_type:complete
MKLKIGQSVFGKFGWAKINRIELCEKIGDKEGIQVQEVWHNLSNRCVFDMDNGHFEYGLDIDYNPF